MGEGQRPDTVAVADEEPHPEVTIRQISAWSLAILAAIGVGFLLYAAREVMLPVVAAFVVGVGGGADSVARRARTVGSRPDTWDDDRGRRSRGSRLDPGSTRRGMTDQ